MCCRSALGQARAWNGLHGSCTEPEPWQVGCDGLYRLRVLRLVWTCIPTQLPHRYAHHTHWRALAGGRAERWPIDSKIIYRPRLPMEGHPDFRHSHRSLHTDPKKPEEQLCPQPACGGDGVQPMCCSWHRACLQGVARTKSTFNIRQPLQGSQR